MLITLETRRFLIVRGSSDHCFSELYMYGKLKKLSA